MPSREEYLQAALGAAVQRYEERNKRSRELHLAALESMPGGNTRTLLHNPPFPTFIKRGEGYKVFDEDGHEYVDLVAEMTAGLFGHGHPTLLRALTETAETVGLSLGATHAAEARLAALLCQRFGLGRLRFTNSGTEANLHALAAARKHTGRRTAVVFSGGYHGSVLSFGMPLAEDGGEVRFGPAENTVDRDSFVVLRYNDAEAVRRVFRERGGEIAAVLVEGMQGSGGFIPGKHEFLLAIQEECEKAKSVFILDEVMTSRLAPGGLQSTIPGLRPTLTTLGKYIGGGLPFGAFGGSEPVMAVYDPRFPGTLAHSGTFQNNTLMLHVGHAALSQVYTPEAALAHSARGDAFRARLRDVVRGSRIAFTGLGSFACLHVSEAWGRYGGEGGGEGVKCKEEGGPEDEEIKTLFWLYMLERGFWVQKRGNIALILDIPQEALDRFVDAVAAFIREHEQVLKL
ncbi:hypothetical protein DL769_011709 [Monosporascus sp. CRB-8-3]|nr:hypothetical protein DL769_011709 [Monosporascus sp. CRB-8-3]